jgi:hypothetical protein
VEVMKEQIFNRMQNLHKKKDIMKEFDISSDSYKEYYSQFIYQKKKAKLSKQNAIDNKYNVMDFLDYDARNEILGLKDTYGVYLLSKDSKVIYVGVSLDLGSRILTSMCSHPEADSFSYIDTNSISDAYILEVMLINIIKPSLNELGKGSDTVSFDVPFVYQWEDLPVFNKKNRYIKG